MRILPLLGAATALGAVAAPASAQYYPSPQQGYGYPQQQGGLGAIIGQLLGGRRYAGNEQQLISQCAAAAQNDVMRRNQAAYGQQRYDPRYGQQAYGYNQYGGQARVTAITNVERRGRNNLRVTGLIDSGMNAYAQPPYGNAYGYNRNQAYQQADLSFRCTVDSYGRITSLRLNRAR